MQSALVRSGAGCAMRVRLAEPPATTASLWHGRAPALSSRCCHALPHGALRPCAAPGALGLASAVQQHEQQQQHQQRRRMVVAASQAGGRGGGAGGTGGGPRPPMKKKVKKLVDITGDVTKDLGNGMFQVKLENGVSVMAYLSGKIQQNRIKILPGDKVTVELSPYDLTKGRITRRFKPGELAAAPPAAPSQ